ncbi:unnamed protein product [Symbiodinium microadriaticum]|nr:unnamed protein product [Symbiodinium microadriaticum]
MIDALRASNARRPKLAKVLSESTFMQGRRPQQEDRHVKIPDLTKAAKALKMPIDHLEQPCAFLAVYDGHRGPLCAEFVAKSLHLRLLKHLTQTTTKSSEEIGLALKTTCQELDEEFLAKHRTAVDGCTVVMALLTGSLLTVAWLGDSRALLCRSTSAGGVATVPLTQDHRPSASTEADRVREAGGMIVNFDGAKRVAHAGFDNQIRELRRAKAAGLGAVGRPPVALAVTRALGDRDFKVDKPLLIATPSVRSFELDASVHFIALMCDGITDVLSNEEIIFELDFLRDAADASANARKACGDLVQKAYSRGSQDNLTVVMAFFEWEGEKRSSGAVGPVEVRAALRQMLHQQEDAMAVAATPPVNYPRGEPPTRCAECGNVLVDALVLSCGHDLCLTCAASALRQTRSLSGRTVRCLLCPSITELCEEAVAALTEQKLENGGLQPQLLPQPQACSICSSWIQPPGARSGTAMYPPRIPNERTAPGLREAESPHSQDGSAQRGITKAALARPHQVSSTSVSPVQWQRTPEPLAVEPSRPSGRTVHIYRCPEHPEEPATYFCATCECLCICAECVIQKNGRHRDHEVLRVAKAHEVLKSRAGALLDEAIALEDDFSMVGDRLAWRRKDIERAAARGRASVRSAFARVRAQLNEREAELLESLDAYETGSLSHIDTGHSEYGSRLNELRKLQENLRSRCRNDGDAVEALNTFSTAKAAITSLREAFRQEEFNAASPPDEFVGLAGSARAELDLHAEGLASLEEAVASLCERGVDVPQKVSAGAAVSRPPQNSMPQLSLRFGRIGSIMHQGYSQISDRKLGTIKSVISVLRGISKNYTVRMVQHFLDTACGDFEWKRYNFLYLPRRGHSHSGLAIVNFIDAQSCATCECRLRLLQSEGVMSGIKSIGESYIQGFAQNLAYYAAMVSEDARDANHVLVLVQEQAALLLLPIPMVLGNCAPKSYMMAGPMCRASRGGRASGLLGFGYDREHLSNRSVRIVMIEDLTIDVGEYDGEVLQASGRFDDVASRVMLLFFPAQERAHEVDADLIPSTVYHVALSLLPSPGTFPLWFAMSPLPMGGRHGAIAGPMFASESACMETCVNVLQAGALRHNVVSPEETPTYVPPPRWRGTFATLPSRPPESEAGQLAWAVKHLKVDKVRSILERWPHGAALIDDENNTLFHLAAANPGRAAEQPEGAGEVLSLLLQNGWQVVDQKNTVGERADVVAKRLDPKGPVGRVLGSRSLCFEEPLRVEAPLQLLGEASPRPWTWQYPVQDEQRRSFAGVNFRAFSEEQCSRWMNLLLEEGCWIQLPGVPRKVIWYVSEDCADVPYRYSGLEFPATVYPPFMKEICKELCTLCGIPEGQYPNSCNVNVYDDGSHEVGWHSDDEVLFQGLAMDTRILSLSLGSARDFSWRLQGTSEALGSVPLGDGDVATMEGLFQKHYKHAVAVSEFKVVGLWTPTCVRPSAKMSVSRKKKWLPADIPFGRPVAFRIFYHGCFRTAWCEGWGGATCNNVPKSLPLVGVTSGIDATAIGGGPGLTLSRQELTACSGPCSGALALRRVTTLLQGARRADAQGEHQQAKELYSEVLKVQKSLSRAPMGSFGKSLRDVANNVEARLTQLKQEIQEEEGGCSSSGGSLAGGRTPPGALALGALGLGLGGLGQTLPQWGSGPGGPGSGGSGDDTSSMKVSGNTSRNWEAVLDCPLSARDGYDRPATRDGARPCTQDGSRWRLESRPVTRDGPLEHRQTLDGVRPSTRDGARLQQMIDGNRRSEAGPRPGTRDGRASTRGGTAERRGHETSLRQATGRSKKRHPSQHAPEVLNLDTSSSPEAQTQPQQAQPLQLLLMEDSRQNRAPFGVLAPECLSPCMDADESAELLE